MPIAAAKPLFDEQSDTLTHLQRSQSYLSKLAQCQNPKSETKIWVYRLPEKIQAPRHVLEGRTLRYFLAKHADAKNAGFSYLLPSSLRSAKDVVKARPAENHGFHPASLASFQSRTCRPLS
jgi:hypothetical protein